jgi:hypothetical protein
MVENADPANPDTFRSRGQPEVLDGTAGAIQIRVAHRGTAQHMMASPLAATGHANIDRRLLDSFELQTPIEGRLGTFIVHGRLSIRLPEELLHGALRRALTDDDKIPRLHEPNRPGVMRGV